MGEEHASKEAHLMGEPGVIEVQIRPPGASGVVLRGETAAIRVELYNRGSVSREVELRITLTPHRAGVAELKHQFTLTISRDDRTSNDVALLTDKVGFWRVTAEAVIGGETVSKATSAVSVVEKPRNYGKDDPESFFGSMHIKDYEAAQRLGIKVDRIQAYWRFLSRDGAYDNIGSLDRSIDEARRHGLSVMLTIRPEMPESEKPPWVQWKNDSEIVNEPHIETYRQHIRFLLERYRGKLLAVELLNEPDLMWYQQPGWDVDDAARIVAKLNHEGYKAIKETDPDLPVLGLDMSGGDMLSGLPFTKRVLDHGPEGQFDFFAGHPYTNARHVDDANIEQWPEDYDLRGVITRAQDLMASYGISRRYWNTELGWDWKHGSDPLSDVMFRHAAITARALLEARSVPGFEKVIWFDFSSRWPERTHTYALVMDHPCLAASAYATASYILHHATPAGAVAILPEIGAWRFDSVEDNETIVALWDDRPGMLLRTVGVESLTVYDMFGVVVGQGSDIEVELSREPLYYRVPLADGDRLVEKLETSQTSAAQPIAIDLVRFANDRTLRVAVENRLKDEMASEVELDGRTHRVKLVPGISHHEFPVDPPVIPGVPRKLQVTVEGGGHRVYRGIDSQPLPIRRLRRVLIDGKLDETAQLDAVILADRSYVKPPDDMVPWRGPDDLSASIWLGWNDEGFYFAACVTDDVHHTVPGMGTGFWQYDSVQIALDPKNDSTKGRDASTMRIGAVLAPEGPQAFLKGAGQIISHPNISLSVVREDPHTVYEMLVPWRELGMSNVQSGQVCRLTCTINDSDGSGRKCWMELSGGIEGGRGPDLFREFMLV